MEWYLFFIEVDIPLPNGPWLKSDVSIIYLWRLLTLFLATRKWFIFHVYRSRAKPHLLIGKEGPPYFVTGRNWTDNVVKQKNYNTNDYSHGKVVLDGDSFKHPWDIILTKPDGMMLIICITTQYWMSSRTTLYYVFKSRAIWPRSRLIRW